MPAKRPRALRKVSLTSKLARVSPRPCPFMSFRALESQETYPKLFLTVLSLIVLAPLPSIKAA
eukprot:1144886-Pelagomonas_calceolata.AAC.3